MTDYSTEYRKGDKLVPISKLHNDSILVGYVRNQEQTSEDILIKESGFRIGVAQSITIVKRDSQLHIYIKSLDGKESVSRHWMEVRSDTSIRFIIRASSDDYPHHCPWCKSPAYIGFLEIAHADEPAYCPARRA